ncbi:MAG UNVERIFIED_CONTAM: hypothetical protein LVR18_44645 [Planctomycetaceae bacterium]|jgi:hypothetical protein
MNRAIVLVGVQHARGLPRLQAVLAGVTGMEEWANSQGIPAERIRRVTDESGDVTPQRIRDAIRDLLQPGNLDQLIIYFAGHGLNVGWSEYWLLSDASDDPNAAVNLKASEERRGTAVCPMWCSFRMPADQLPREFRLRESLAAPSLETPGLSVRKCRLICFSRRWWVTRRWRSGILQWRRQTFQAVYTEALLEALRGQHPDVTVPDTRTGGNVVRPWPLQEIPRRRTAEACVSGDQRCRSTLSAA